MTKYGDIPFGQIYYGKIEERDFFFPSTGELPLPSFQFKPTADPSFSLFKKGGIAKQDGGGQWFC